MKFYYNTVGYTYICPSVLNLLILGEEVTGTVRGFKWHSCTVFGFCCNLTIVKDVCA